MTFSIVIPTWNHLEDCLKPCMTSLLSSLKDIDCEIIVVANGCKDETASYIRSLNDKRIMLLEFEDALGSTKALNRGIEKANGDVIILLNNDVLILDASWLNLLLRHFEDELVGIVGPQKRWHNAGGGFIVPFFCTAIGKSMFEKLGLLDEIFSPGTCEDVDFCRKVSKAGFKIIEQDVPVIHKHQATMSDIPGIAEICQRNDMIVFHRHNERAKNER